MGSPLRLSDEFVRVALARIGDPNLVSEANLRRATSDLYYAAFHAICEALVEPLGLHPDNAAFKEMYLNIYRQTEHGYAEKRCRIAAKSGDYSPEIARFSKIFVTLKNKREQADYHPLEQFRVSEIRNHCAMTQTRLASFWTSDPEERAAFACYVGLRAITRKDVSE